MDLYKVYIHMEIEAFSMLIFERKTLQFKVQVKRRKFKTRKWIKPFRKVVDVAVETYDAFRADEKQLKRLPAREEVAY